MNSRFESLQRGLENTAHRAGQGVKTTGRFMLRHSPEFLAGLLAVNTPDPLNAILRDSESSRQGFSIILSPKVADAANCQVSVDPVREQFYLDKGGPKDSAGRPQYDEKIDQILGPAFILNQPKRRVLIEAIGQTPQQVFSLEVDQDGIGRMPDPRDPKKRISRLTFNGNSNDRAKVKVNGVERLVDGMRLRVQSLASGYVLEHPFVCNLPNSQPQPTYLMSQRPGLEVQTGPTVVPTGERMAKTPVPTQVPDTGLRPAGSGEAKPATDPEAIAKAVEEVLAKREAEKAAAKPAEPAPAPAEPSQLEQPEPTGEQVEEEKVEGIGGYVRNAMVLNVAFRPAGSFFDGLGRLVYNVPVWVFGDIIRYGGDRMSNLGFLQGLVGAPLLNWPNKQRTRLWNALAYLPRHLKGIATPPAPFTA